MVHGQVNPPTLDLANRELIQSLLHAVWLSETGQKLDNSICGLLDMNNRAPNFAEPSGHLGYASSKLRAHQRGVSILNMLQDELTKIKAPWYSRTMD